MCVCLVWQRLHVFLFELALVLTRPAEDREGAQVFHVYRQPLPNAVINLEEIPDGEAGGGGTFRGAFTGGNDKGNINLQEHIFIWFNPKRLDTENDCVIIVDQIIFKL